MKKIVTIFATLMITISGYAQTAMRQDSLSDSIFKEKELEEVVVKAHLPKGKHVEGGTAYNVAATDLRKVGTATDVLALIPTLKKKLDGTFEVVGKGAPVIYIDNRKVYDLAELTRLKASELKNIELLTQPGAKYDASMGVVVRINTLRKKENGISINASTALQYSGRTSNEQQLGLDWQHGKVEIFGNVRYSDSRSTEDGTTLIDTHVAGRNWHQNALSLDRHIAQTYSAQTGVAWQLSKKHSMGVMYEMTAAPYTVVRSLNTTDLTQDNLPYDRLVTHDDTRSRTYPTHHTNLYYIGKVGKMELDMNYDFLFGRNSSRETVAETSLIALPENLSAYSRDRNIMHAVRLTAAYPVWKGMLSAGMEYTNTLRRSASSGYEGVIEASDDKIKERNTAWFADYNLRLNATTIGMGMRYEHVDYNFYSFETKRTNLSRLYHNLFPCLSVNMLIGNAHVAVSYRVCTVRPRYQMLSSAVNYGNRYVYMEGTPELQPTFIHTIGMNASWKDLSGGIDLNHYKDDIFLTVSQKTDNAEITLNKFSNFRSRNELSLRCTYAPTIGWWKPELTVVGTTQWLRLTPDMGQVNRNGTVFDLQWSNSFSLPADITLRIDGEFSTKGNTKNIYRRSNGFVNISATRGFANERWNVLLEINDLFHTRREGMDINYLQRMTKTDCRNVKLTVSYRLHARQNKYKGKGAGVNEMNRF